MTTNNTNTSTNNTVKNTVVFDSKLYAGYMRSASSNRISTFATLYGTTLDHATFLDHADKLALAYSTSAGVDTATLGLLAVVSKLPENAFDGIEAKARLNVQVKPTLKLDEEFAKLLVPFLNALATVSKYCTVS